MATTVPHTSIAPGRALVTDQRRHEIERGIELLRKSGVTWTEWADRNGFSAAVVRNVRRGRGSCSRGEAFRVAETLRAVARGGLLTICQGQKSYKKGQLLPVDLARLNQGKNPSHSQNGS